MGIQGLLPLFKSVMAPIHIRELQGCRVAVDTYSWLHKGALSCSTELCKGLPTSRYIEYCMHRVNMLRHHGVKPILVFDGGFLPMKKEQENKRERARKENLERALEHESNGNSSAAYECYQKAVDISPAIAFQLIQVLKKENVDYIVAPYEADAQMTFLALGKHVEAVITEDSDLIPFGCPRIIFKMDKYGQGTEFQYSMIQNNRESNFTGFTKQMVLEMCILSGCDYLQSLPGMGLKKAHALVRKFKTFDKVIKHLRYNTTAVPPFYEDSFKKAIWTFKYQRVYDPNIDDIVHLSDLSDDIPEDLDFLGPLVPRHLAKSIARGEVDPITKLPFEEEDINAVPALDRSYQLKEFKPDQGKRKLDLPAQKNILTNYFCFASLEAKRNFRAPRVSPKPSEATSPCSRQEVGEDGIAWERNSSPISLFDLVSSSESMDTGHILQKDKAISDSPLNGLEESPRRNMSWKHSPSIDESCLVSNKEHEVKRDWDAVSESSKLDCREVTTVSSYRKQKCEEDDPNNENNRPTFRSSYFTTVDENAPDLKSGKVVVRSSYFRKNLTNVKDANNENENHIHTKDGASDGSMCENSMPKAASLRNDYCESLNTKRKASQPKSIEEERSVKHARTEASIPDEGTANEGSPGMKFQLGCDITHLDRYSEISERSLEKFTSVISSFQFNSSGSRASGLRAPLREIRNTLSNRLGERSSGVSVTDISRFAYAPNSKKAVVASRRR